MSLGPGGVQARGDSELPNGPDRAISADGRFVAWTSAASNLIAGNTNHQFNVFLRDRLMGSTEPISLDSAGTQGNARSGIFGISLSADGRLVVFASDASNLAPGDTNGVGDVFLRDRSTGTTERLSVSSSGAQANGESLYPAITPDGRFVSFTSLASNLVAGDTNNAGDIFVRDRLAGTTERVSLATGGSEGNAISASSHISNDGRFVAFQSFASNLVPGDTNGVNDVFIRDRANGTTERVSVATNGAQGDNHSGFASLSGDGRYVAFQSYATTLVAGDTNGVADAFIRDRATGTTERVSVASTGAQGDEDCLYTAIPNDGRYVLFESSATNLVANDTNSLSDVFIHDRRLATTERMSVSSTGSQAAGMSHLGALSPDARYVVFSSSADNLVSGDTNASDDIFIHDRFASGFTSTCDPASGNVIACPCGNPPSGLGRGCDNSSATGGAVLTAAGIAYLSIDSLVFTTSGERPTAFSIVMQGNTFLTNGVVYGQGVRCVGGATKRLYTKTAVAGSITAPDFGGGDPTVSARSAAKGDVIQPGQGRWYLVYYRDPNVLGGCPASSTFNATQTGQVTWWP